MYETLSRLNQYGFMSIRRSALTTLQINIGLKCNQQCVHCHVNSSPRRTEMMSEQIIAVVKSFLLKKNIKTLDITGGAPELHPLFRDLVVFARLHHIHVIDRCNLTILLENDQTSLAGFLAEQGVEIIASLPCYQEDSVDAQRGKGVFEKSIIALQTLNQLGYGQPGSGLILNLVYNPQGSTLPPSQQQLQQAYQSELKQQFNIVFNRLFTLCNMPIQRFGSTLISKNQFDNYLALLSESHNDDNLDSVMCKSLISVDWLGRVYDCDFNQMLKLNLGGASDDVYLADLLDSELADQAISVRDHCYGCTAGQGSSCGGALN